jgi:hypothetical protein
MWPRYALNHGYALLAVRPSLAIYETPALSWRDCDSIQPHCKTLSRDPAIGYQPVSVTQIGESGTSLKTVQQTGATPLVFISCLRTLLVVRIVLPMTAAFHEFSWQNCCQTHVICLNALGSRRPLPLNPPSSTKFSPQAPEVLHGSLRALPSILLQRLLLCQFRKLPRIPLLPGLPGCNHKGLHYPHDRCR